MNNDPVNGVDPTGEYNCSGKPDSYIVARYSHGGERYNLLCGHADPSGYGIRHIQQANGHFAGDVSNALIFLMKVTIAKGKEGQVRGGSTDYSMTWVWSSSDFPEAEPFPLVVAIDLQHGRVLTAYSPSKIVDQNRLDDCHFAGVNACGGFGSL